MDNKCFTKSKPLYNSKTNRCIQNTSNNRKRLGISLNNEPVQTLFYYKIIGDDKLFNFILRKKNENIKHKNINIILEKNNLYILKALAKSINIKISKKNKNDLIDELSKYIKFKKLNKSRINYFFN